MTRSTSGKCLIINNSKGRKGSDKDAKELKSLFKTLKFDVEIKRNLTALEIGLHIDECKKEGFKDMDMFIFIVLAHGNSNSLGDSVAGIDGNFVEMEKGILEPFNDSNCQGLIDIPKLFIFQACRGTSVDQGVVRKRLELDGLSKAMTLKSSPSWKDILIAQSTIPSYASFRDTEEGSLFIQTLIKVFHQHAKKLELKELLDKVNAELQKLTGDGGEKQACEYTSRGFNRKLYFKINPKSDGV